MRSTRSFRSAYLIAFVLALVASGCHIAASAVEEDRHYYAIEINGTLCGYGEAETSSAVFDGEPTTVLDQKMFMMLSALGSEFNTEIDMSFRLDPVTGEYSYHEMDVKQGPNDIRFETTIVGNEAHIDSTLGGKKTVELPEGVVLSNSLFLPFLKRDFVDRGLKENTYDMLMVQDAAVQQVTFKLAETTQLELAGRTFDAVVLDQMNLSTGLKIRMSIDAATAQVLRVEVLNRHIYLSDASVMKKVEAGNLNPSIISKVDTSIADVQGITYMKVRATIEPIGVWVTPESLNVPGQRFTGTVEDNLIEGVFEIEHIRYDGANAPAFPPDFANVEELKEYLEPGDLVESDDPVLRAKALQITAGSKDSWEAATRLSDWVAENIDYAIPGGGTARKTYDTLAGECGAHSNLVTAFCRAAGIPARVVWGCMYIPNFGGAFGQHGWNEVYMGDAGWVPLDATAYEADYVDSGHIRVGAHESLTTALNPIELEVLEYRLASSPESPEDVAALEERYDDFVGDFENVQHGKVVHVKIQDGSLVVDIPNQVALALDDPGDDGKWPCKITDRVYMMFTRDESDAVVGMKLHELVRMRRTAGLDEPHDDVPAEFRDYLGKYLLPQVNAEFTVRYLDGSLAVDDPLENTTVRLRLPDEDGGWLDEFDKNTIYFDTGDDGEVVSMTIDAVATFKRS